MGARRSARARDILLAILTLVLAAVGTAAMSVGLLALSRALSLRPLLVVLELLLVAPSLLALPLLGVTLRLRPPLDRRTALVCLGLGFTLWVGSLGLLELQYAVWPPAAGYLDLFRRLHEQLRPRGPLDALASLLAIAVAPAVCEEVQTRGICLPSFQRVLGSAGAIVASAIVFGLMHLDLYRLPFAFAVGIALGMLRVRTGLLLPSMLAHATLNTLTFAAAPFLDDPSQGLPDPRPLLGAGLLAGGAAATALLWRFRGALALTGSRHPA